MLYCVIQKERISQTFSVVLTFPTVLFRYPAAFLVTSCLSHERSQFRGASCIPTKVSHIIVSLRYHQNCLCNGQIAHCKTLNFFNFPKPIIQEYIDITVRLKMNWHSCHYLCLAICTSISTVWCHLEVAMMLNV